MFVRQDIWGLEQAELWDPVTLAYAHAVREMQDRAADDPTSWAYQANIHGSYDEPAQPEWNQCQHASWFFLPWHRMYIYWFERIVRATVAELDGPEDWALPYWNYSKGFPSTTLPPSFREPQLPDGSVNPLFVADPGRNPAGINAGARLPDAAVETSSALRFVNFTPPPLPGFGGSRSPPAHFAQRSFTGSLENVPHNVVHGLVGGSAGLMADPNTAAQDPIFWLHHSNIDRVWAHWQAGDGVPESDSVWLDQGFDFFSETGERVTMTVSEIIDHATDLSYRYDDEPPPVARGRRPGGPAVRRIVPEEAAASELAASGPVALGGGVTSVSLPVRQEARETVRRLVAPEGESAERVQLTVEDVQAEHDPGVVYAIYLGSPEDAGDPSSDRFVGYVTFFGASHVGHGEQGYAGISHAYDITEVLRRLQAQGRWLEAEPTVTFVPTGLEPPPGAAGEATPAVPRQVPGARIGRVTITSG